MAALLEAIPVAKKRAETGEKPKRYGTLIRVSDEFAASITRIASFEKLSVAEFADTHFLPLSEKRFREAILREAKKMEGK